MKNMNEEWRAVKGFEGYYEVSNMGNVRSVERNIINSKGVIHKRKSKDLKLQYNNKIGYYQVMLRIHQIYKLCYVHRLVGEAFVCNPYPDKLTMVVHINGERTDNRSINLRWKSPYNEINNQLKITEK